MSTSDTGRIGPFELRGVLGRGGSATVYRAFDPALNREVAIKVLTTPREEQTRVLRERFRREAQAIAGLRHPNIVNIYSSGEERGLPYLVMELSRAGRSAAASAARWHSRTRRSSSARSA
jgi:serine/threonine protein kinase